MKTVSELSNEEIQIVDLIDSAKPTGTGRMSKRVKDDGSKGAAEHMRQWLASTTKATDAEIGELSLTTKRNEDAKSVRSRRSSTSSAVPLTPTRRSARLRGEAPKLTFDDVQEESAMISTEERRLSIESVKSTASTITTRSRRSMSTAAEPKSLEVTPKATRSASRRLALVEEAKTVPVLEFTSPKLSTAEVTQTTEESNPAQEPELSSSDASLTEIAESDEDEIPAREPVKPTNCDKSLKEDSLPYQKSAQLPIPEEVIVHKTLASIFGDLTNTPRTPKSIKSQKVLSQTPKPTESAFLVPVTFEPEEEPMEVDPYESPVRKIDVIESRQFENEKPKGRRTSAEEDEDIAWLDKDSTSTEKKTVDEPTIIFTDDEEHERKATDAQLVQIPFATADSSLDALIRSYTTTNVQQEQTVKKQESIDDIVTVSTEEKASAKMENEMEQEEPQELTARGMNSEENDVQQISSLTDGGKTESETANQLQDAEVLSVTQSLMEATTDPTDTSVIVTEDASFNECDVTIAPALENSLEVEDEKLADVDRVCERKSSEDIEPSQEVGEVLPLSEEPAEVISQQEIGDSERNLEEEDLAEKENLQMVAIVEAEPLAYTVNVEVTEKHDVAVLAAITDADKQSESDAVLAEGSIDNEETILELSIGQTESDETATEARAEAVANESVPSEECSDTTEKQEISADEHCSEEFEQNDSSEVAEDVQMKLDASRIESDHFVDGIAQVEKSAEVSESQGELTDSPMEEQSSTTTSSVEPAVEAEIISTPYSNEEAADDTEKDVENGAESSETPPIVLIDESSKETFGPTSNEVSVEVAKNDDSTSTVERKKKKKNKKAKKNNADQQQATEILSTSLANEIAVDSEKVEHDADSLEVSPDVGVESASNETTEPSSDEVSVAIEVAVDSSSTLERKKKRKKNKKKNASIEEIVDSSDVVVVEEPTKEMNEPSSQEVEASVDASSALERKKKRKNKKSAGNMERTIETKMLLTANVNEENDSESVKTVQPEVRSNEEIGSLSGENVPAPSCKDELETGADVTSEKKNKKKGKKRAEAEVEQTVVEEPRKKRRIELEEEVPILVSAPEEVKDVAVAKKKSKRRTLNAEVMAAMVRAMEQTPKSERKVRFGKVAPPYLYKIGSSISEMVTMSPITREASAGKMKKQLSVKDDSPKAATVSQSPDAEPKRSKKRKAASEIPSDDTEFQAPVDFTSTVVSEKKSKKSKKTQKTDETSTSIEAQPITVAEEEDPSEQTLSKKEKRRLKKAMELDCDDSVRKPLTSNIEVTSEKQKPIHRSTAEIFNALSFGVCLKEPVCEDMEVNKKKKQKKNKEGDASGDDTIKEMTTKTKDFEATESRGRDMEKTEKKYAAEVKTLAMLKTIVTDSNEQMEPRMKMSKAERKRLKKFKRAFGETCAAEVSQDDGNSKVSAKRMKRG